jgi:hypothetical protein
VSISDAWEALRGDPLPWLLDARRPNLQWRTLVELVRRPVSSPAVARARGGANAVDPVAALIADFNAESGWPDEAEAWVPYSGTGWRTVAAVQWGADPSDPRLHAAAHALLRSLRVAGDRFVSSPGVGTPVIVARTLQALAALGWCREPRFHELLAWLDEGAPRSQDGGWLDHDRRECPATAVAVAHSLATCAEPRRTLLAQRAVSSLLRALDRPGQRAGLGYPGLRETDDAEMICALARLRIPFRREIGAALEDLQRQQGEGGRWCRVRAAPSTLGASSCSSPGEPSRWLTLECVTAVLHFAVDAGLPRLFPTKPQ